MKTFLTVAGCMALLAAACGAGVQQQTSGPGWDHVGWFATESFSREPAVIFTSRDELQARAGSVISDQVADEAIDYDSQVVLVIENGANGCGPTIFNDVRPTEVGVTLNRADTGELSCTDELQQGVSVFALDLNSLPSLSAPVILERDDKRPQEQTVVVTIR